MPVTKEDKLEEDRRASEDMNPQEGGWGWMIVAGCFLSTICIRAVTRCVSMFFVEFQMYFEKDYSSTAWIHSMIDSTTMLCAPFGSFLGNQLSCRATIFLGGLLSSTGLILSSFASSLEFLYISLGIITGLGFALSYTPAIAMVGRYFNERKALAYGIAMSGSGIGTFLLAPAVQMLIEHYTWRGALLILGGIVSNLCVCGALMRPPKQKSVERMWENNMTHVEKSCITAVLESGLTEQVDCSRVEPKQQEIHNFINIRSFQSFGLESDRFKGNIRLLPHPQLPDERGTQVKMTECMLFSSKLETMLGEMEENDMMMDSELMENIHSFNTLAVADRKNESLEFIEAKSVDDETVSTEPLVNTQSSSSSQLFCVKSKEELGFLGTPRFLILSVSFLFLAYGCSVPLVYLVPYALRVGVEHQHAAFLMSIFGVSGIVGNITFGWITDRKCLKKYRILSYIMSISMEGFCCLFLPFLHSFSLLVPFSTLYGYFDGAYVALIPVVTSDIVGSTHLTSALGVVYFLHAVPYLISPPIGGWLVDQTGNYASTFFLSGASFILSSLILVAAFSVTHVRSLCGTTQVQGQHPQKTNQSQVGPDFYKRTDMKPSNI